MTLLAGILSGTGVSSTDLVFGRRFPGQFGTAQPFLKVGAPAVPAFPGSGIGVAPRPGLRVPGLPAPAGPALQALLGRIADAHDRALVQDALANPELKLDSSRAGDVSAAFAYVWVKTKGHYFNPNLRNTAASVEQAARDVMDYERARPGMFEKFLKPGLRRGPGDRGHHR